MTASPRQCRLWPPGAPSGAAGPPRRSSCGRAPPPPLAPPEVGGAPPPALGPPPRPGRPLPRSARSGASLPSPVPSRGRGAQVGAGRRGGPGATRGREVSGGRGGAGSCERGSRPRRVAGLPAGCGPRGGCGGAVPAVAARVAGWRAAVAPRRCFHPLFLRVRPEDPALPPWPPRRCGPGLRGGRPSAHPAARRAPPPRAPPHGLCCGAVQAGPVPGGSVTAPGLCWGRRLAPEGAVMAIWGPIFS